MEKNMSKFNEEFIINYDEDSDKGYILASIIKCIIKFNKQSTRY